MLPPPPPDRALELQLELTRTGLQRLDSTVLEAPEGLQSVSSDPVLEHTPSYILVLAERGSAASFETLSSIPQPTIPI